MTGTGNHNAAAGNESSNNERLVLQRKRSIAIAVSLALLVALFYVATLVKMGSVGETARAPARSGAGPGKAAKP